MTTGADACPTATPLRMVIRRLPSKLTNEEFLERVPSLPPHFGYSFVPADQDCVPYSRVYLTFDRWEDAMAVREQLHGQVFADSHGAESTALVEVAPYQHSVTSDDVLSSVNGTLVEDPDYLAFVEKQESAEALPCITVETILEEIELREKSKSEPWKYMDKPPLAKYYDSVLMNRKRIREEKRKQKEEEKQKKDAERQKRLEKVKKEREAAKKANAEQRKAEQQQQQQQQHMCKTSKPVVGGSRHFGRGVHSNFSRQQTNVEEHGKVRPQKRSEKTEVRGGFTQSTRRGTSSEFGQHYRKRNTRGRWNTFMNTVVDRSEQKILYESDLVPEDEGASDSRKAATVKSAKAVNRQKQPTAADGPTCSHSSKCTDEEV